MAHTYKIEKAVLSDVKGIISLRVELLKEVNEIKTQEEEKTVVEATERYLKEAMEKREFVSFVAKDGDEIVSVSGLSFFTRPPYLENLKGKEAYLLNMYTLPSHRKRGLARKILQECMKECQKSEVKRVWLHASQAGEPLYKSIGFQSKGSEMELFFHESEGKINK
ncbi:GNAT family N-acetyltransferase [Priestia flexa]|uniref:GNAT family N-acetyltransferase n=1 Tax=Priestia flexa TaxID=86664 RepID=UPI001C98D121|nr:GNAT family N-acetyltransferase [Priestia flexa]MBY6087536.1 GNAT family N-acetyltransferase [Priestia flexa]